MSLKRNETSRKSCEKTDSSRNSLLLCNSTKNSSERREKSVQFNEEICLKSQLSQKKII